VCVCTCVRVTLWVDHERPAARVGDDNAVVDAEIVDRETGDLPRSDLHSITQRRVQRERVGAWNLLFGA